MTQYNLTSHPPIELILFSSKEELDKWVKVNDAVFVAKVSNILGECELYQSGNIRLFIPIIAPNAYKH